MTPKIFSRFLQLGQRGSVAIPAAFFTGTLVLASGLIVDEDVIFYGEKALQTSANMAALAGAAKMNVDTATAISTATQYAAKNTVFGTAPTVVSGYPAVKCLASTGVSCGSMNANAIQVKLQVILPQFFGSVFGSSNTTITATATAGSAGGLGSKVDVMMIIDTTASMNSSDPNCSIKGVTRLGCALAGAQTLLQAFQPGMAYVGLMTFPGVQNATQAAKDYACPGSNPTIVSYKNSPDYLIVSLSNDYKTSGSAASLNTGSNLVKAAGGVSGCAGLKAIGGYGTFYADVITAAQNVLKTTGRSDAQKAIIFLSDGDANGSSSNVPATEVSKQCHEGITAAQAATTAGTWVFTAAYGSPTGVTPASCSTDTASPISACTTMQTMASTADKFFPVSGGSCTSTINPSNDVLGIFRSIGNAMTSPRLVLNSAT